MTVFVFAINVSGISYNVLTLANPKGLSVAHAERVARLSLAGLSAAYTTLKSSSADRGACDDALNAVLYDGSSDTSSS